MTYGVYPSSFSPALICCEYPSNAIHPAVNGVPGFSRVQIKLAISPISVVVQVGLWVSTPLAEKR